MFEHILEHHVLKHFVEHSIVILHRSKGEKIIKKLRKKYNKMSVIFENSFDESG